MKTMMMTTTTKMIMNEDNDDDDNKMITMVQDRGEEGRMGAGANGRGVSEALDGATGVSTFIIIMIMMTMTMTTTTTITMTICNPAASSKCSEHGRLHLTEEQVARCC